MSFRISPRLRGAAAVLAAGLGLAGCNKLKLGYEYADWFVVYSVEDNFDLDKSQRTQLKADVDAYFLNHRAGMLPEYADFLDYAAQAARNGLRPAEIDSGYARYKILYRRTLDPVLAPAARFLSGLTSEQVDEWLEKQRKKNLKLRKAFSGTLKERLEHRYRKIVDELEDWTGRLTKDQKGRIKALNGTLPWNGNLWLDTRERMQEHLAELLKKNAPADEIRDYLGAYLLEPDSLRSEEYRARNAEFEKRIRIVILGVSNILTLDQKRRFLLQVEKLAKEFRTMSRQE